MDGGMVGVVLLIVEVQLRTERQLRRCGGRLHARSCMQRVMSVLMGRRTKTTTADAPPIASFSALGHSSTLHLVRAQPQSHTDGRARATTHRPAQESAAAFAAVACLRGAAPGGGAGVGGGPEEPDPRGST